jgi:dTDP-4-amino-4,6-dideoxygalactose transaminase
VLESGAFVEGPFVAGFERTFADHCRRKHCIGVGNGSDALFLALRAAGVGPDDEVITTAFSFVATAQAIVRTGAAVRFVDIQRDTFNLDPRLVEGLVTKRTRAIVPVHLFGRPADSRAIHRLACRHRLAVVEDAAQACGATADGKPVGSFGKLSCFSFYPTKNLGGLGDGGAVVTDSGYLAERVRKLSRHARLAKLDYAAEGFNSRLDAIQAALLTVKLGRLPEWTQKRRQIAALYRERLAGASVAVPTWPADVQPAWHVFPVRVPADHRDPLQRHLHDCGVETRVYYPRPLPRLKGFGRYVVDGQTFPETSRASQELLGLPMSPNLTAAAVGEIAAGILGYLAQTGRRYGAA